MFISSYFYLWFNLKKEFDYYTNADLMKTLNIPINWHYMKEHKKIKFKRCPKYINWNTRIYMCQIENIEDMDCTDFFDKTLERFWFFLRNPLTFVAIFRKKMKSYNTPTITYQRKQNNVFSRKISAENLTVLSSSSFKEGDIVRIRSREEIQRTLDKNYKLEGCLFMDEMWQYCGTKQKIIKKVENFYDEANFRMCKARNIVLLEGLHCPGKFQRYKANCDRFCLFFEH